MNRKEAHKLILNSNGKIFSVKFIKRTDNTIREMVARLHVKGYLKGGVRAYDFEEKGLVPCFDMQKQQYRCFGIEALLELKIEGKHIVVED